MFQVFFREAPSRSLNITPVSFVFDFAKVFVQSFESLIFMISKHCNIGAAKHIEKNERNKLFQTPDTYDRETGREILVNCNDWWCLTYETTLKIHKSQGANEHLFQHMMTSSNGNIFRVTGPLCGEFTGHRWQWRGTLMFSLICVWINGWVNDREAGDLRRYRAHYDVTVMTTHHSVTEICTCVHISPKNGALLDICLIWCGICDMGLIKREEISILPSDWLIACGQQR